MENIHIIPTDKLSRLQRCASSEWFDISKENLIDDRWKYQHIYITSDEEIKEGDWFYSPFQNEERILKYNKFVIPFPKDKKIILTTDQDLIKDGVQSIDDEFVNWFVNNPSCEEVKVNDWMSTNGTIAFGGDKRYQICNHLHEKIIIPKEEPRILTVKAFNKAKISYKEPKQESIEEAAEKYVDNFEYGIAHPRRVCKNAFINGAKWHAERSHSDEEVYNILEMAMISCYTKELETHYSGDFKNLKEWFEQFKKENNETRND